MYYNFKARRLTPVLTPKQKFLKWFPSLAASRDGRTALFVQIEVRSSLIIAEFLQSHRDVRDEFVARVTVNLEIVPGQKFDSRKFDAADAV